MMKSPALQVFFIIFVLGFMFGWVSAKGYWEQVWKQNAYLDGINHQLNVEIGDFQKRLGQPTATPLPTPTYLHPGDFKP